MRKLAIPNIVAPQCRNFKSDNEKLQKSKYKRKYSPN